jgi:hypothetical protein
MDIDCDIQNDDESASIVDSDQRGSDVHGDNADQAKENEEVITKNENSDVTHIKLMVLLVLIALTICVAFALFYYTRNSEESQFEEKFNDDEHKVLEAIGSSIEDTLGVINILAASLVSYMFFI